MIKLKEIISQSNKRYSAVVIDEQSRDLLISTYKSEIPEGWEIIAHHMTINPFGLTDDTEKPVQLKVDEFGKDDKAIAVKVSGYDRKTNNKYPHITIAINRINGAKPKDSNNISNWRPIDNGIILKGVVQNL